MLQLVHQAIYIFFPVSPVNCSNVCTCYYLQKEKANVLNCSNVNFESLNALEIPEDTTWIIANFNNIPHLCSGSDIPSVRHIDFQSSGIVSICDEFFETIKKRNVKYLNLAWNEITKFSEIFKEATNLDAIFLAGNPIECMCDTLWFADWLEHFTTPSGERVVKDYREVKCTSGLGLGTRVYQLDGYEIGCYDTDVMW